MIVYKKKDSTSAFSSFAEQCSGLGQRRRIARSNKSEVLLSDASPSEQPLNKVQRKNAQEYQFKLLLKQIDTVLPNAVHCSEISQ